jgi:hypothetical protein
MDNVYPVNYKDVILKLLQAFVAISLVVIGVQIYFIIDAKDKVEKNVYTIHNLESKITQCEEEAKRAGIPPGRLYGPPDILGSFVLEKLSCHEGFAQFKNISNQTFSSGGNYFEILADGTKIAGESCQGKEIIEPREVCSLTFRSLSSEQELIIRLRDLEGKEKPVILVKGVCRELEK